MQRSARTPSSPTAPIDFEEVLAALPLLHQTPRSWAELAVARWPLGGRRKNPWAQSLKAQIVLGREPWTKVDRLLFGAMIGSWGREIA